MGGHGQVHADAARTVEGPAVLPDHAHPHAGFQQFVQRFAVGPAPVGAVQKQHVGAFRLCQLHAVKMGADVLHRPAHVFAQHLAQLVQPGRAGVRVSAHQRVHPQHVHLVVVGQRRLFVDAVPQAVVVDDVIAAHQPRQVEGLGGRVQRHGALAGVLADRLGRDVLVAGQHQVAPDLVRDHRHVVLAVDFHGLLHLPAGPDPAAGVVRRAEDGRVDVVLLQLFVHVGVVHPPHAVLVLVQRAEHDAVAVIFQHMGKADVGGRVQKDGVAGRAQHPQRGGHAAQHAVFVADVPGFQAGHAVAGALPVQNGVIVFLPGRKIAKGGVPGAVDDGVGDAGGGGKVHVRHPHGDAAESGVHLGAGDGDAFHRNGVPAFPRQHGGKVKWHRGWHFLFWFGRDPAAQPAERRPQGRGPDASSLIVSYRPAKYKAAAAAARPGRRNIKLR